VSTDNQLEVRLWLTRRALRLLWPLLVQMRGPRPKWRCKATRRRATPWSGWQHEQALGRANFTNAFEEAPREMPLGAEPILVVRIQANKDDSGTRCWGCCRSRARAYT